MPTISVIIPAYNAATIIGDALWALRHQSVPRDQYEVIVVDDGSTDATTAVAEALGARVLHQPQSGPAVARNQGARAARGELLLFTDADCTPTREWIANLTAPFHDPQVVGAKGRYTTKQTSPVARLVQLEYEEKYDQLAQHTDIDFIDTYSAAYRRDVFLEAGGFDTTFRAASVEDQELSFRMVQAGHRLRFVPQACVAHRHVTTLKAYARRKYRYGYWKAYLLRRHPTRITGDSHTPKTQLAQMAWVLGVAPVTLAGLALRRERALASILMGAYLATAPLLAAPFLRRVAQRDVTLVPYVPLFLLTRAAALNAGLLAGAASLGTQPSGLVVQAR